MKPALILIGSDQPGSGKDAIAVRLARYGYKRYAFGDAVKEETTRALTDRDYREEVWPELPEATREALVACLVRRETDTAAKPTSPSVRALLQTWGTEFRKKANPRYWIGIVEEKIAGDGAELAVVTDQRFRDEFRWGRRQGGVSWYVTRPGVRGNSARTLRHASEGALAGAAHDWRIPNDGTLEDLWKLIDARMDMPGPYKPINPYKPKR